MVVDDERPLREVIAEVLRDEGYAVREAPDGVSALRLLETVRPDLMLMDVMMPGLDGHQVYLAVRAREELNGLPVVLMSAAIDASGLDPTISDFLRKPFSIDKLLHVVERLLQQTAID